MLLHRRISSACAHYDDADARRRAEVIVEATEVAAPRRSRATPALARGFCRHLRRRARHVGAPPRFSVLRFRPHDATLRRVAAWCSPCTARAAFDRSSMPTHFIDDKPRLLNAAGPTYAMGASEEISPGHIDGKHAFSTGRSISRSPFPLTKDARHTLLAANRRSIDIGSPAGDVDTQLKCRARVTPYIRAELYMMLASGPR